MKAQQRSAQLIEHRDYLELKRLSTPLANCKEWTYINYTVLLCFEMIVQNKKQKRIVHEKSSIPAWLHNPHATHVISYSTLYTSWWPRTNRLGAYVNLILNRLDNLHWMRIEQNSAKYRPLLLLLKIADCPNVYRETFKMNRDYVQKSLYYTEPLLNRIGTSFWLHLGVAVC